VFHRAIISAMAVSPEDLAAGALALQVFVENAKNVEIIVGVAFAVIPTILGLGAAGLLGSGIINTAKEIRNSINLLKTFGTGILYGNVLRYKVGGKLQQSNKGWVKVFGIGLAPELALFKAFKSRFKKKQDTQQDKQEEQGSGGGGGNPPTPPDTKSDKKEEQKKE
jgi:hypothetical protein